MAHTVALLSLATVEQCGIFCYLHVWCKNSKQDYKQQHN